MDWIRRLIGILRLQGKLSPLLYNTGNQFKSPILQHTWVQIELRMDTETVFPFPETPSDKSFSGYRIRDFGYLQ